MHECGLLAALLAAALTLAADAALAGEPPQVAAVVNGVEITQREVEAQYQRSATPGTPPAAAATQRRAILDGLVRTELLAQQALADRLDQTPEFLLDTHQARRQTLALQVEQAARRAIPPLPAEALRQVIAANPYHFAERQLLLIEELQVSQTDQAFLQALDREATEIAERARVQRLAREADGSVTGGAALDRLEGLARQAGARVKRVPTTAVTTDQLPPELVKPLLAAKPGVPQVVLIKGVTDRGTAVVMHAAAPTPITGEAAEQLAGGLVQREQLAQALRQRLTAAQNAAQIAYQGEFAAGAPSPDAAATPAARPLDSSVPPTLPPHRLAAIAGAAALACAAAVLLGVIAWCYWRRTLWLPRLWPARAPPAAEATPPWGPAYDPASWEGMLFVALLVLACVGALGVQLLVAGLRLGPWVLAGAVAGGLALGVGASHLYARASPPPWTRRRRWWSVIAAAALLLGTAALGLRFS